LLHWFCMWYYYKLVRYLPTKHLQTRVVSARTTIHPSPKVKASVPISFHLRNQTTQILRTI